MATTRHTSGVPGCKIVARTPRTKRKKEPSPFQDERRIIPVNLVYATNPNNVIDNPNNITVYSCDVQKPGCVFCTSERICTEAVVTSINPLRVSSSGRTTLSIVGSDLNAGSSAVLHIKGMSDHITVKSNNCTIENSTLVRCVLPDSTHGKKTVCLVYDSERLCVANRSAVLEYVNHSSITEIRPTVSWTSGGRHLTIIGRNLDVVKEMQMWFMEDATISTECSANNRTWICVSPSAVGRRIPGNYFVSFCMSGSQKERFPVAYHQDPVFYNFTMTTEDKTLRITALKKKDNLQLCKSELEIYVWRTKGDPVECNVTEVTEDKIKCELFTSSTSVSKLQ
uniref:plexin-C1-like n=1 Tax=Pristiophorus japonicus TaxID=55135 RepID=UPI00398F7A5D